MRLLPRLAAGLSFLVLTAAAAAADAPSPLRLVPDSADLLVQVRNPRRLVDTVTQLDAAKQLQEFPAVKELMDSTDARRYYQLVAYFEKQLGADRLELLDKLAGGGAVLAAKFGPDPAPVLLVIQGKDEKLMRKFADVGLDVIGQELARQEVKVQPEKFKVGDVEVVHIGDKFYAAVVGAALVLSNNDESMRQALRLHLGKEGKSMAEVASVADAAALLPPEPLASLWVNFESVRQSKQFKEFYDAPRDVPQTVVYGGFVDILGQSPFICAALCKNNDGLMLTGRLPRGRSVMGPVQAIFLPPEGKPGCRPPLTPPGVLYTESFYLDPAPFWNDRAKLFSEQTAKGIEEADKNSGRFLSGLQISKLLTEAGPYHRFVAVDQPSAGYKTTPKTHFPAFAVVTEMRDPDAFGRHLETVLRGAALLATTQVKLKMDDEPYKDCTITTYRFPEDAPLKNDVNDIRFNFTPSFTRVGNQFVVASTAELCRSLVDELKKEQEGPKDPGPREVRVARAFSDGAAPLLRAFDDTLVSQVILDQAVSVAEAKEQAKAFIEWVGRLGEVDVEQEYTAGSFRYDIRWKTAK